MMMAFSVIEAEGWDQPEHCKDIFWKEKHSGSFISKCQQRRSKQHTHRLLGWAHNIVQVQVHVSNLSTRQRCMNIGYWAWIHVLKRMECTGSEWPPWSLSNWWTREYDYNTAQVQLTWWGDLTGWQFEVVWGFRIGFVFVHHHLYLTLLACHNCPSYLEPLPFYLKLRNEEIAWKESTDLLWCGYINVFILSQTSQLTLSWEALG